MSDALTRAVRPISFDHSGLASWPEYDQLNRAIYDFGRRWRWERGQEPMAAFVVLLSSLARSWPYASDCKECRVARRDPPAHPPYRATVDGRSLEGDYRCPVTGRTWSASQGHEQLAFGF